MEELESILKIVNQEAKQRYLESADEFKDGHPIGVKCENCGHTKFNSFGYHREARSDGLPGFVTVMYLCCENCREMIFYIYQSLNFVPVGPGEYKPHWSVLDSKNFEIQKASIRHFNAYMNCEGDVHEQYSKGLAYYRSKEKSAVELIDWL